MAKIISKVEVTLCGDGYYRGFMTTRSEDGAESTERLGGSNPNINQAIDQTALDVAVMSTWIRQQNELENLEQKNAGFRTN